MERIVDYLIHKYAPESIVLYGSYADGSCNFGSDFDALVITERADVKKDTSIVDGIQLDVMLVSPDDALDCREWPQLYDSRILMDRNGKGAWLCEAVRNHIDAMPEKSRKEIETNLVWCKKMLLRTERADAEGYFRWHWVLCDSLEFYSDIRREFYFGPKKTLRKMERDNPDAFRIYTDALSQLDRTKLEKWIGYLTDLYNS